MRLILVASLMLIGSFGSLLYGQWQQTAKQIPDFRSLPDMSQELQDRVDSKGGNLQLSEKIYRLTRPLEIDLATHGAISIRSNVGSTLIMDGPGPAVIVRGNHEGTASPKSFQPSTWNERMPILTGFEVLGAHPEADGIELIQTVGAVISKVSVRWCRHGIHLTERNRNVIVSDCHLYENSGIGVFLDDVNLHQINVGNSHISYNRSGGVVVRDGNVRNLQITGCDIEGNMPADETPTRTANVWIDVSGSAEDKTKSIAEIAITGCTIQHSANYGKTGDAIAPGGANIRLSGKQIYPIDSVTITGNVLSDTTTSLDIQHSFDVTVSSNTFFAPKPNNVHVEESQRVVISGNTFNPRQFTRPGTIRFLNCQDCILANCTMHKLATDVGAIRVETCTGMMLTGLLLSECGSGIFLKDSASTTVSNCRVSRTDEDSFDILIDESNHHMEVNGNSFAGYSMISSKATERRE
ncbi:MAG: right-handed parallel beta-helix repeat-containing protein [Rubripirellula sp.]